MSAFDRALVEAALCPDSDCTDITTGNRSISEPEEDGDHRYFVCPQCGMEFGYSLISDVKDPSCQLNIPEKIRRPFMRSVESPTSAVSLGTTIRMRNQ